MKVASLALCVTLLFANDVFAQARPLEMEQTFSGPGAKEAVCSFLIDARHRAEIEGRLDFTASIGKSGTDASANLVARIRTGSAFAVRRIDFAGHRNVNDSTLRRTFMTRERDMLNVQELRGSLMQVDRLGMFERLSLDDVDITRVDGENTVDLRINLRERKRRWWSIAGILLPGTNPLKASVASRLPSWGSGILEMATFFISLNTVGFGLPFVALERSLLPGQELVSGFAITFPLSPRALAISYGRTHALDALSRALQPAVDEPIAIDLESADPSQRESMVCKPSRARAWWLRAAARQALTLF